MSKARVWLPPTVIVLSTSVGDAHNGGPSAAAIDAGSNNYANDPDS